MLTENITKEDIEDLRRYCDRVKSLRSSSFVSFLNENKQISFSLNYKKGQGLKYSGIYPTEESIKAFMVDFSQIYLTNKQPANFHHITNILFKNLTDEKFRESVVKCRELYNKALNQNPMGLVYNEKTLKPQDVLNHWVYSEYRHDDRESRKIMNDWEKGSGNLYKFNFLTIISDLLYPIIILANIAEKALASC